MALKTSLHKNYAVSSDLEENGAWTAFDGGVNLKIRRLNSAASLGARRVAEDLYKDELRGSGDKSDVNQKIAIYQFANGVITDWDLTDAETGEAIPYTAETAIEILSDPEMKEFAFELFLKSNNRATFHADNVKADVKN